MNPPRSADVYTLDTDHELEVHVSVTNHNYNGSSMVTLRDQGSHATGEVYIGRHSIGELIEILESLILESLR